MKARIKKTGEIVNIAEYASIVLDTCDSHGDPICLTLEDVELIQEPTEDEHWQDVRERAAIVALSGLLADPNINVEVDIFAKVAINYADALIEELKKK